MSLLGACFLFVAAMLAGLLNSVAGGGGLIIFPALLMTGLPSISANATSTFASLPGYIASIYAYRHEFQTQWRIFLLLGSIGLVGGILGAMLLLSTPTTSFDIFVPWLLLLSTLLFTFSNSIATQLQIHLLHSSKSSWVSLLKVSLIQFFIAIYGGFYGAGISFLILATLGILGLKNIHQMNALKILLMSCIDSFAIITFITANIIVWPQAVLMMLGTIAGGYGGAKLARYLNPYLVRRFVIFVGFTMTCYFFYTNSLVG